MFSGVRVHPVLKFVFLVGNEIDFILHYLFGCSFSVRIVLKISLLWNIPPCFPFSYIILHELKLRKRRIISYIILNCSIYRNRQNKEMFTWAFELKGVVFLRIFLYFTDFNMSPFYGFLQILFDLLKKLINLLWIQSIEIFLVHVKTMFE